ncbi:NmrA/HSCARG family protein [Spirosoma arcticum]
METTQVILVTGATGHQGNAIAHQLLQRKKFAVRGLVRDGEESKPLAQALRQAGAELVVGDLNDPNSLRQAMQGCYGVFSMQGIQDGMDVEIKQGKAVVDAAKAAGIGHFVYSSVGSAERQTGIPHFDSKFQVEDYVRASGLPYTIMRPVFFFFNYDAMRPMIEGGTLSLPLSPDTKLQQLSEDDYGMMVADVFERPGDFLNQERELASVELTMTETAATFSRVLGRNVDYQQTSFDAFKEQTGEENTIMFRWFEEAGYSANLPELTRDFHELTGFEPYLRDHDWATSPQKA